MQLGRFRLGLVKVVELWKAWWPSVLRLKPTVILDALYVTIFLWIMSTSSLFVVHERLAGKLTNLVLQWMKGTLVGPATRQNPQLEKVPLPLLSRGERIADAVARIHIRKVVERYIVS